MFYKSFPSGRQSHQKELCRRLRATPYAIDYTYLNPMTIRLVSFNDSLQVIRGFSGNPGNSIVDTLSTAGVSHSGAFSMNVSNSHQPEQKPKELEFFPLYKALHSFYANGGSCLDRLSVEINSVYSLKIKLPDFRTLANPKHRYHPKTLINGKYPQITSFINSAEIKIANDFMNYRNREIHDGVVRLDHRHDGHYLPNDPENQDKTLYDRELYTTCKDHFEAIEKLIDVAYTMMWKDYQEQQGQLPLKGRRKPKT